MGMGGNRNSPIEMLHKSQNWEWERMGMAWEREEVGLKM